MKVRTSTDSCMLNSVNMITCPENKYEKPALGKFGSKNRNCLR